MPTEKSDRSQALERQSEELYLKYGKRFEPEHNGEYLVISPKGQTVLGATLLEVVDEATERFGAGNFIYKIGERVLGNIR